MMQDKTENERFYADLPSVSLQEGLCNINRHTAVPADWYLFIVDIVGSTRAITEGRYKDVNIASACAITAVLNRVEKSLIAYIFGGDGATFLVPPRLVKPVAAALYGAGQMSLDTFGLKMRAGMVTIRELKKLGGAVRAAKIQSSPSFCQCALSGEGVGIAEELVKNPKLNSQYHIEHLFSLKDLTETPPSFEGFECRWEPLQSRHGVDVSAIIVAQGADGAINSRLYQSIVARINDICGHQEKWRPVSKRQLEISANPANMAGEAKARRHGRNALAKALYLAKIVPVTWAGKICLRRGLKMGRFDGARYGAETIDNSDYIKFDNALRLTMDISHAQKASLEAYLEELHRQGKIYYGLHEAAAAVMTCLVFDYQSDHYHFIDGADGGYSLAARNLKKQRKEP